TGPGDCDVKTSVPAQLVQRAELESEPSRFISPVANAENDDVALITLNALKVFDEPAMQPVTIKHDAQLRRLLAAPENLVFNRAGLRLRKCYDADRQIRVFPNMKENAFDNLCCLN